MKGMKEVHHKYRVAVLCDGEGGVYTVTVDDKQDVARVKALPNLLGWATGWRGFTWYVPTEEIN